MKCYFIDSYGQPAFSYCAPSGIHLSALGFTRMLGNYLFTYVHNSVKTENTMLYSFLVSLVYSRYVESMGAPCFIVLSFGALHRYSILPVGGLWEACIEQVHSRHFSNSTCSLMAVFAVW